jgi:hypothetical protein
VLAIPVFVLAVFAFYYVGYPLNGFHFPDFLYLSDRFSSLHGFSPVDQAQRLRWEVLYHNLGLMTAAYYLISHLELSVEGKLLLVNALNIAIQLLNVGLFAYVVGRFAGKERVFPCVFVYLLYPFAAATHFWQACIVNNLAVAFFLASLSFFLNINYAPGNMFRNLAFRVAPSLLLFWFSIMTVEWAICLSPLYVYLALYYSNGKAAALRFQKLLTTYSAVAVVFVLTSLLPIWLGTGHRLLSVSPAYAARYGELAAQTSWSAALVALGTVLANGVLVCGSFLFANTLGLVIYPLADIVRYGGESGFSATIALSVGFLAILAGIIFGTSTKAAPEAGSSADTRALWVLGLLWSALAYFPFTLSFAYPRNVGLFADRVNVLGSMGVALCVGALVCVLRGRLKRDGSVRPATFSVGISLVALLLLMNVQIQKAMYLEAEKKEHGLIDAVLAERARVADGREPVFLLDRAQKRVTPRMQLHQALAEPSVLGKLGKTAEFALSRYFTEPVAPTNLNFSGIFWFYGGGMEFFAHRKGLPAPVTYIRDEPLEIQEDGESYILGYPPTPSFKHEYRSFPRKDYRLLVFEIGESSFRLGGPLVYRVRPYP